MNDKKVINIGILLSREMFSHPSSTSGVCAVKVVFSASQSAVWQLQMGGRRACSLAHPLIFLFFAGL
jgi:hypothetical protein